MAQYYLIGFEEKMFECDCFFGLVTFTILSLFIWAIYKFSKLDCDLELLLLTKFGRSLDNYHGKVVWITGSSSGIGEELAYTLAKLGSKLVLSGTNKERLENVARKCVEMGPYNDSNVLALQFDITDTSCHQDQLDRILTKFGKLDILVNNAGRSQRAFFQEITVEVDKALFDINVFSLVNLTRVVLNYYFEKNPDGQFAVTSSTAGIVGVPYSASYTGSKHALHGYFECLRMELGTRGIAITMLALGPTFSNVIVNAFTGKLNEKTGKSHQADASRMSTSRCAHLMAIAIINKLDEAWIAQQPVLSMHYISQYFAPLARKILPRFMTVERMNRIREGK